MSIKKQPASIQKAFKQHQYGTNKYQKILKTTEGAIFSNLACAKQNQDVHFLQAENLAAWPLAQTSFLMKRMDLET